MIILGIDPGTVNVGYGVISKTGDKLKAVDYGIINLPKTADMGIRLKSIYEGMKQLIETHSPDTVAMEKLFFGNNRKTAMEVSQAIGVIILAVATSSIELFEYTPLQIKQALVGYGGADKQQIQFMTRGLLNLKDTPKPDHAADALAVAICHAHSIRMLNLGVSLK